MALELKDVLAVVGIDEADIEKLTPEDVKGHVEKLYVLKDNVYKDPEIKKTITGKAFGGVTTEFVRTFGLKHSDVEGKKLEEVFPLVKEKYESTIKELSEKAGAGNDKKLEEALKERAKIEAERDLARQGLSELEKKLQETELNTQNTIKTFKLNDKLGKVKESLAPKFTEEFTKNELVKTGFEAHIASKYAFDLDDKDNPIVISKADGKPVGSKTKAGHTATPEEVLLAEMDALGVLKKNNAKNDVQRKTLHTFADNTDGVKKSKVHPNALRNAG